MGTPAASRFSIDEYLAQEEQAEFRSEYFNGEVFAMAGATPAHSRICNNLGTELNLLCRNSFCGAYSSDTRIWIAAANSFVYPDASIICGKPVMRSGSKTDVTNPVLAAEVISRSSDGWDQVGKFHLYKQLPSLREYLIVYQHAHLVEHHVRQDNNSWVTTTYEGLNAEVPLLVVAGAKLSLGALYANVELDPDAIGRAHGRGIENTEF
jgi:Uma2 family endonuclease